MPKEKYPLLVYFLTAVASLGGLLFGYATAVISGAVVSLENQLVMPLEHNPAVAIAAISGFKLIISICVIALGFLFSSIISKFFKPGPAYAIVVVFNIAGGFNCQRIWRASAGERQAGIV